MTLQELIDQLAELSEEHGADTEVRLAIQPNWPFEHSIGKIVAVQIGDADEMQIDLDHERHVMTPDEIEAAEIMIEDERKGEETIIYIGEQGQLGYLCGAAVGSLDWGR